MGNILISPHPDSLRTVRRGDLRASLSPSRCDVPSVRALQVGELAVGAVVSLAMALLDAEAQKYRASYSGATSNELAVPGCIQFEAPGVSKLLAPLEGEPPAFRIEEAELQITGFKSKVAAWPIATIVQACRREGRTASCLTRPWRDQSWDGWLGSAVGIFNPLMLLHALYRIVDDDLYKLDVAVRMRIDTVALVLNQAQLTNLARLDLDFGKVSVFDLGSDQKRLRRHSTGYLPLPYAPAPGLDQPRLRPANVTITVVEASDFGDLVGKAARQVGERRSDIRGRLVEWLGF
jgi:hypothetical protein